MKFQPKPYVGIDEDRFGGMTAKGKIIRDAWIFGILDESETCKGWLFQGIEDLHHKVNDEWDKYGCSVSSLPPEIRERHDRIHAEAITKARELGWSGELETEDEA